MLIRLNTVGRKRRVEQSIDCFSIAFGIKPDEV
jgi:hypothetical protein